MFSSKGNHTWNISQIWKMSLSTISTVAVWALLDHYLSKKSNMVVLDFYKLQSCYKLRTESFKYCQFEKFSKNFCFHRKQCKIQIIYGNAYDSRCTVFQNRFQLLIGHASFFHFPLRSFARIAFCAVDCQPDVHTLPPPGNFADIPYLKEQSFLHRIRDVCTL